MQNAGLLNCKVSWRHAKGGVLGPPPCVGGGGPKTPPQHGPTKHGSPAVASPGSLKITRCTWNQKRWPPRITSQALKKLTWRTRASHTQAKLQSHQFPSAPLTNPTRAPESRLISLRGHLLRKVGGVGSSYARVLRTVKTMKNGVWPSCNRGISGPPRLWVAEVLRDPRSYLLQ